MIFGRKPKSVSFAWHKFPPHLETIRWSEADIQSFIVLKLRDLAQDCPNFLFHADMGGMKTNIRTASKSKALGMERGVPDLFLFLPGGRLICIELKTAKGSVSAEQKARHKALSALGFQVYVIKAKSPAQGWSMVRGALKEYGIEVKSNKLSN